MTIADYPNIESLRQITQGKAVFNGDTVTIGTYTNGGNVSLPLVNGDRTCPTVIVGCTGSGKTDLIESLHYGAQDAGIEVDFADTQHMTDRQVIADVHALIQERNRDLADRGARSAIGVLPLRLLLVDDFIAIDHDTAGLLTTVVKMAPKAGVAVIVGTQMFDKRIPGGALMHELLSTGNRVEFRTEGSLMPRTFEDGSTTAGIGFVDGEMFRAWWSYR